MREISGLAGLRSLVGVALEPTDWLHVDQDRVDAFAACTQDPQWIHVDVARARASEYGGTIAHGFLTLSLIPHLWEGHFIVLDIHHSINYGLDRVRFPAPLPVGSRIRGRFTITRATDIEGGLRVAMHVVIEREGHPKPVCIADALVLFYG